MIYDLVDGRRGHFLLESGLHSELWLDLDPLFADEKRVAPFVAALADELRAHDVEVVCGALVGGAFLAQFLAQALGVEFCYTAKRAAFAYELPRGFAARVVGKRVAIVDDVMSAGSALRGTYAALRTLGASVIVAGALLVLGAKGLDFFTAEGVPVVSAARDDFSTWSPTECPLCAAGVPLEDRSA